MKIDLNIIFLIHGAIVVRMLIISSKYATLSSKVI
jgi:hypothetical protein